MADDDDDDDDDKDDDDDDDASSAFFPTTMCGKKGAREKERGLREVDDAHFIAYFLFLRCLSFA